MDQPNRRFAACAWGVLGVNVLVVLWGALVRATGSGAGCGRNWPSCQGALIPTDAPLETWIEFVHRASSGLALLLVLALAVWALRVWGRHHRVSRAALWAGVFVLVEAGIGAGLVLLELVAENSSAGRAWMIALHLANTYLLIGALALCAWWAAGRPAPQLRGRGGLAAWLAAGSGGLLLLGMSGAVTALGDTLFPMSQMDVLDPAYKSHFLVQLRIWHPLLAVLVWVVVLGAARRAVGLAMPARGLGWVLAGVFGLQLALGTINVVLQAPLWLQLVHLTGADSVWVLWTLLAAAALASPPASPKRRSSPG